MFLYLDSPALVFCKVPMKCVHLMYGHHVNITFHLICSEEMSSAVQMHSAPFESRLVMYDYIRIAFRSIGKL